MSEVNSRIGRMSPFALATAAVAALLSLVWARDASSHNPVTTTVRFNREIASVINAKCAQCHAPDGMAMSLQTYAEARPWAVAIKEEILARRMPPWPAERGYGAFANDIGLTPREQEFLISWIDGGVPIGEGEAPAYSDHGGHWMLGEPDRVLAPQATTVSTAADPDGMRRLIIDSGLEQDAWVRGFDFKPGDKTLRAAFFTVVNTGQYLGGWTPWASSIQLPEGVAFSVPARSRIAVDMLYGSGAARSSAEMRMGLYLAKNPERAIADIVLKPSRTLRPGHVRGEHALASARTLFAVRVEMGRGGRSIELKAKRPDGSFEPLLWIRDLRQDWQTPYVFRQPVALPQGSVILATARFDPSVAAPQLSITINAYEPLSAGPVRPAALQWPRLLQPFLR